MRLLILFLSLLAVPASAAVRWVVATVAADTAGTADTYASPYGIQAAFTAAAAGDDIRIVNDATNAYGSASTSWTNRNADKSISSSSAGNADNLITVTCWTDETTQVTALGSTCQLNFTGGTGDGIALSGADWLIRNIRVTGAADDGFQVNTNHSLYRVVADSNTDYGIDCSGGTSCRIRESWAYSNGKGALLRVSFVSQSMFTANAIGIATSSTNSFITDTIIANNTGDGVQISQDNIFIRSCTIRGNGGDGIEITSANAEYANIENSLLVGNTGYGLNTIAGSVITRLAGNNYYNNTAGAVNLLGAVLINEDSSPDTSAVTFVSSTDYEVTAGGTYDYTFIDALTHDVGVKGAVQATSVGGGGGTRAYSTSN